MQRISSQDDVYKLIENKTAESITLEFKAQPWERKDKGNIEALKDITSLANTRGGHILIGIAEEDNAAQKLVPISREDAENERGRINDLITGGVEPRLYGVDIVSIEVNRGFVLSMSIPRSPSRPHRVTSGGHNRFWLRHSTGKYEANVEQLRSLFLQSAEMMERAERYHLERNAKIMVERKDKTVGTLHIIHSDAFSGATLIDVKRAHAMKDHFKPWGTEEFGSRYIFEGVINNGRNKTTGSPSHTIVHRNGIVEAVTDSISSQDNELLVYKIEKELVQLTQSYVKGIFELGVVPPYLAYVTLNNVAGRHLAYSNNDHNDPTTPIKDKVLNLPVAIVEKGDTQDVAAAFKPAFDALWNAGGQPGSRSYEKGKWAPPAGQQV